MSGLIRQANANICILKDPRDRQILNVCATYLQYQPMAIPDLILLCKVKGLVVDDTILWRILWDHSNLNMRWRPSDNSFIWDGTYIEGKSWLWELRTGLGKFL
jgi:hypothetical protein